MKTLSESIIGRKGTPYRNRKGEIPKSLDDLEYGDFIEISGDFGGTFLYVPRHVTSTIFNDDVDAFVKPSNYWTIGSYGFSFPYSSRGSHKIERIIWSVRENEYKNLKTRNDLFHLFDKYNIPIK